MAPDHQDKCPQILQISDRRSLTRQSLLLSQFTSNLNPIKYITAVGIYNMDDNLICAYFQLDIAHLENQTVYVRGLLSWLAGKQANRQPG